MQPLRIIVPSYDIILVIFNYERIEIMQKFKIDDRVEYTGKSKDMGIVVSTHYDDLPYTPIRVLFDDGITENMPSDSLTLID